MKKELPINYYHRIAKQKIKYSNNKKYAEYIEMLKNIF